MIVAHQWNRRTFLFFGFRDRPKTPGEEKGEGRYRNCLGEKNLEECFRSKKKKGVLGSGGDHMLIFKQHHQPAHKKKKKKTV